MAYVINQSVNYPTMFRVRQPLELQELTNIEEEVALQLKGLGMDDRFGNGHRIAITAGSRGICNIARITKAIADYVKSCGGKPFIVPAMGTHGGATAEGQTELLSHYGITKRKREGYPWLRYSLLRLPSSMNREKRILPAISGLLTIWFGAV